MAEAIVWSKDNCAACNTAIALLDQHGFSVEIRKIDGIKWKVEDLKKEVPSARMVPQIFIEGLLIGTLNELKEYLNG